MKEMVTNKKLNAKLQKSLELIKEANEMIELQKNQLEQKDKDFQVLWHIAKEWENKLKDHLGYKFSNWLKSFTR